MPQIAKVGVKWDTEIETRVKISTRDVFCVREAAGEVGADEGERWVNKITHRE